MLRHLLDTGWSPDVDLTPAEVAGALGHVPRTVHEVIGRRYSGISDRARQVLDVAAVVGPRFAIGVLRQVSGLDEELLLDALDETSRARLTREIPDLIGSYGFAHAISRDVIYARLSAARRSYLHRRVAEAVERRPGSRSGGAFAELAYHFQAAGEPEKAARYAIEAGDHAFGCSAYEGAARYYESALHLGLAAPQQQQQRCRTLMALAAAQRKAGQVASAREAYLEATRLARDLADPEALAGCALGLAGGGRGVSAWIADEVRISLLEEALAVLGSGDSELRVKVLTELAKALYFSQEAERRDALASEAVDVARRLGTATVVAGALSATRVIRWGPANTELRLAYGDEVLALSEQSGDAELVVRARLARLVDLIEMGSRPSVDREVDSILDLAGCLHQPYYLWRAISWDAHRALMDGRVRTAEQRSVDALAAWGGDPHEDAMQCGRIQLATLAVMQGRASEAVGLLRPVAEAHPMIPSYRCLLAFILSKAGRAFEARAEFERFAADGFLSPPVDGNWLLGIGALAETCAYLQDRPRAKVLYELLTPFGDRMLVFDAFGGGGSFWGSAAHQLGLLAATTGAIEVAERHLRAALEANTRFGARHAVARTERALGALATIVGTQG
jgi:tetratricopeptide (TPR) repeat protein